MKVAIVLTGHMRHWREVLPKDPKSYIAEIPKASIPNVENVGSVIYKNKGAIPIDDIKFYKEDWLRGYKPIKVPKSNFKKRPKNIELLFKKNLKKNLVQDVLHCNESTKTRRGNTTQ